MAAASCREGPQQEPLLECGEEGQDEAATFGSAPVERGVHAVGSSAEARRLWGRLSVAAVCMLMAAAGRLLVVPGGPRGEGSLDHPLPAAEVVSMFTSANKDAAAGPAESSDSSTTTTATKSSIPRPSTDSPAATLAATLTTTSATTPILAPKVAAATTTAPAPAQPPAHDDEGATEASAAANPFAGVAATLVERVESTAPELPTEWKVVFPGGLVNVREGKEEGSKKLKSLKTGTVVVGTREGNWLKLAGIRGYMMIAATPEQGHLGDSQELLRQRRASYFASDLSDCESAGAFNIPDPVICKHAAAVLGELVNHVETSDGCQVKQGTGAPGGLPLAGRRLGRSTSGKSKFKLICSDLEYPDDLPVPVRTTTRTTTTVTSVTTATAEPWGWPSLFCFAVFRANTPEQDLVKEACRLQSGIFACDTTVTVSGEKIWVGKDKKGKDVWSWVNEVPEVGMGDIANNPDQTTNSWLNTQIFINAIDMLINNELIWQHDWVVKGDPDAVLLPDRIRTHLTNSGQTGNAAFLENCFHDGQWWLYGSLELFSKTAMEWYRDKAETECKQGLDWHGWGEDMYMDVCMKKLGAAVVTSGSIVADHYCSPRDCHDGESAAFHPFKSKDAWRDCLSQTTGMSFPPE